MKNPFTASSVTIKNPFARTGFDSLLTAGYTVNGSITLAPNKTLVLDCDVNGDSISPVEHQADKTSVTIGGNVKVKQLIAANVTITGSVTCDLMIVEGTLAIRADAKIIAKEIRYRDLFIETGAVVVAQMNHLDHISAGEIT